MTIDFLLYDRTVPVEKGLFYVIEDKGICYGGCGGRMDTLVVIKPEDFQRLLKLYPRLIGNLEEWKVSFAGVDKVNEILLEKPELAAKAGFINENDIIPFNDVHKLMQRKLDNILEGRDLPRGITGWYYQQFIKMQYAYMCQDEFYMVWDGDTIPCKKIEMFHKESGKPYFDLKHEHHIEYFETMEKILPGFSKVIGPSFISEHMLIKTEYMKELISDIEKNTQIEGKSFWEKIINAIPEEKIQDSAFSEFETYGTFVALKHSSAYKLREWHSFRQGGTFFSVDTICDRDFEWLAKDFDAISFEKGHTVRADNANLFDNPYYQEKLSPKQMLMAAQEEYIDGYKEVWDENTGSKNVNVHSGAFEKSFEDIVVGDKLKYLNKDAYKIYYDLGEKLERINADQAFLCYENAAFLCDDEKIKNDIVIQKNRIREKYNVTVKKYAFVILSYNNTYMLQKCIESIYTNCDPNSYTLIVLDNNSNDGTKEWLAEWGEKHDEAYVILNDDNSGFSGGNNIACQYLPDEADVFFLNNDTRIPANAAFWLRMALYETDEIGAVGAIQNYFNTNKNEDINYPVVEQYMEHGAKVNIPMDYPYESVSKLCGFAMLVRRDAFDKVDGFDERFNPGYYEDDDFSLQLRKAGYELVVSHNSFIYHAGSQSFRKIGNYDELLASHRKILVEKWGFDSTVDAALSVREIDIINSLEERGYEKEDAFSVLHVGCGCGDMLGRIKYMYPRALVVGVEPRENVRRYAVPGVPVLDDISRLPQPVEAYDIVVNSLG